MNFTRPFRISRLGAASVAVFLVAAAAGRLGPEMHGWRWTRGDVNPGENVRALIAATIRSGEWRLAPEPMEATAPESARDARETPPSMRENALFASPELAPADL